MAEAQSGALSAFDIAHGQFLASSVGTLGSVDHGSRALVSAVAFSDSASSPGSPAPQQPEHRDLLSGTDLGDPPPPYCTITQLVSISGSLCRGPSPCSSVNLESTCLVSSSPGLLTGLASWQPGCSSAHERISLLQARYCEQVSLAALRYWGGRSASLLTPKVFAILSYLVENAGRLVTHDELLEAVWSDTVVEPQAVKRCVVAVRSALGDRPKNSLFIETIPKRGYRFIAPVSEAIALKSPIVSGRLAQLLVGRGRCARGAGARRGCAPSVASDRSSSSPGSRVSARPRWPRNSNAKSRLGRTDPHIAHGQCIERVWKQGGLRSDAFDALGIVSRARRPGRSVQILSRGSPTPAGATSRASARANTARSCSGNLGARAVRACCARSVTRWSLVTAETALLLPRVR